MHRLLRFPCRGLALLILMAGFLPRLDATPPVELGFDLDETGLSPWEREIWATVGLPSGDEIRVPAFFAGTKRWCARVRANLPGDYRLLTIEESRGGRLREINLPRSSRTNVAASQHFPYASVARDPASPHRLRLSTGATYAPIGANLAWAPRGGARWYARALRDFGREGLNWTRIWMCHWGGTNLDWLPAHMGSSPAPGALDLRVAETWDKIVEHLEKNGVYAQVVLQHHGQYTTGANPNWSDNPWNASNRGGFLKTPGEFFTSSQAIEYTKRKYRYIVARWSYSPAILAWELFNEVHWTNAYGADRNEPAVAAWHTLMADYIRSIDPYDHLVTTSLDDLNSPIYAAMDYYQPHLYAIRMLTSVRRFDRPMDSFDRPVFYGEIGDDKMPLSAGEKASGIQLGPQVWAGLMGPSPIPAQPWLGESFLRTRRLSELGAVARFLAATQIASRDGLLPFSPCAEADDRIPLSIEPAYEWSRHHPDEVTLPLDGSDPVDASNIPGILVGGKDSIAEGFPHRLLLNLSPPHDTTATVNFLDAGVRGATVQIRINGAAVATHTWPRLPDAPESGPQPPDAPKRPASLKVKIPAGSVRLELINTGGADWIQLGSIDTGLNAPVIAAAGKRNDRFIALWVWNKRGVHAVQPPAPSEATLFIDDVSPGNWRITWWDSIEGNTGPSTLSSHTGGVLRVATPKIKRHAAVVLTRE